MKFSTNKIIIIVVAILILLYLNRTTTKYEYFTRKIKYQRITSKEIKKRVLTYLAYSNGIMRLINAAKHISILQSINIGHRNLIKSLFVIKPRWTLSNLINIYPDLHILDINKLDPKFYPRFLKGPYNANNVRNDIGTALLRIEKINIMITNKTQQINH